MKYEVHIKRYERRRWLAWIIKDGRWQSNTSKWHKSEAKARAWAKRETQRLHSQIEIVYTIELP